jgi:DNA-binding MarR family transcriptional regulator
MFRSIFDGSLYGQFEPTVVFMAMLVIAEREGIVDMTPEAIAAKCGYPLDIVRRGIAELEKPDLRSRTPDEEGRRIVKLEDTRDWGWRITNYEKYEKIRSAEERREYFRLKKQEQRAKAKLSTPVHTVHQGPPPNPNLHPKPNPERIQNQRALKTLSETVTEKIPQFSALVAKLQT